MRRMYIFVLAIFLFACKEERPKSVEKTEEVKVDKIEKYSKVDDILFVDNEFKPNMDYFFELLSEYKGDLYKMKILNNSVENEVVLIDFIMCNTGNLTRKCIIKTSNDSLYVDYKLIFPEMPPSVEGFTKYQIRLPLNKYKFKYLAFPKSKIVKSLKELSSHND